MATIMLVLMLVGITGAVMVWVGIEDKLWSEAE